MSFMEFVNISSGSIDVLCSGTKLGKNDKSCCAIALSVIHMDNRGWLVLENTLVDLRVVLEATRLCLSWFFYVTHCLSWACCLATMLFACQKWLLYFPLPAKKSLLWCTWHIEIVSTIFMACRSFLLLQRSVLSKSLLQHPLPVQIVAKTLIACCDWSTTLYACHSHSLMLIACHTLATMLVLVCCNTCAGLLQC